MGPRRYQGEQRPAPDVAASRTVPCGACRWPKPTRRSGHRATKDAETKIGADRHAAVAADVQPPKQSECSPSRSRAGDPDAPACPDDALSEATPQHSRRALPRSDRADAPKNKSGRSSGHDRSRWTGHRAAPYEGSALPACGSGRRRSFPHRRGSSPARFAPGCRTSRAGARYTSSTSPSHASGREWWRVRSGSRRQARQSTSAHRAGWGNLPESLQHRALPAQSKPSCSPVARHPEVQEDIDIVQVLTVSMKLTDDSTRIKDKRSAFGASLTLDARGSPRALPFATWQGCRTSPAPHQIACGVAAASSVVLASLRERLTRTSACQGLEQWR